ncbi:hypothetical protein F4778DRAFT_761532 [Xylariomycetidae sp. FL2044]|nr:hypothetical protein F4778DRAFT_761532 [Xylariomycetidae sp. FL2044]
MSQTFERLYPSHLRQNVKRARPFARIVDSDGTYYEVTFADLENASNRAAWFIDRHVARGERFLYMGPNDIRYIIWCLAAMKARRCVLFPSPGNPIAANRRFFQTVGAQKLVYAPEAAEMLSPLLHAVGNMIQATPSCDYRELLDKGTVDQYPFQASFDDIKDEKFLGLHTSGTSGHPKPIYWSYLASTILHSSLTNPPESPEGPGAFARLAQGQELLVPFPLFHLGGLGATMASLYFDNTIVLPAPGTRLTAEVLTTILVQGKVTSGWIPPSLLESALSHPPSLQALSKLNYVAYTGGPLNAKRGEQLAKHLRSLFPVWASTEAGAGHFVLPSGTSRWNSFKFMDVGQRMEEVVPGFYELVFPNTERVNRHYAFFHCYANLETEFRTSDLFSPAGDGWWIYRGRVDNWIAMSNGYKMDPTSMEDLIGSHPDIKGALVAGSHRVRLCLLIELREAPAGPAEREQKIDELWPLIHEANQRESKFGRILKELVMFATREKPFLRASKGTIQRRLTIMSYENELEDLYAQAEEGLLIHGLPEIQSLQTQDLIPFLKTAVAQTLDDGNDDIEVDEDLFHHGIDSLAALSLAARVKAAFRNYGIGNDTLDRINNRIIYKAPTISRLAEMLSLLLSSGSGLLPGEVSRGYDEVQKLLGKYERQLESLGKNNVPDGSLVSNATQTVILTGSTGSLGSYILSSLLKRPDVAKVYCLNRSADAKARQLASFQSRGLGISQQDDERVVFLQTNLAEANLGLSDDAYAGLATVATSIVHNAFPVNFLLSLQSFEPQIQALLNLLKFSAEARQQPEILFISSIAAGLTVTGDQHTVPEAVLSLEQTPCLIQQGYALSKHICERLMERYSQLSVGRRAGVLRVGQICGPLSGAGTWNTSEWAPSLIISSKFLETAPGSLGAMEIDWIPVDTVADIVAELVADNRNSKEDFTLYNAVNPIKTAWEDLLPVIKSVAPAVMPLEEWLEKLENSAKKGTHIIERNPALKLVDFYRESMLGKKRDMVVVIENLLKASCTARLMGPITANNMARWIKAWDL